MLALNEQEFELTDKDFKFIQWFMHKRVGIYLSDRNGPWCMGASVVRCAAVV